MSDPRWPEWLRHGRMFTTDGHMYDTTREHVDIRRITRTIAACHGNRHRLTAHTFMGWAFYDSRLAPKAPGLGNQDWLAEAEEEGARHGVRLLAYFNMLGYLADHPLYGKSDVVDEHGVSGETGVSTLAALQILATIPNQTDGHQVMHQLLEADILEGGLLEFEQGHIAVPSRPGLGVCLDQGRVEAYARLYRERGALYNLGP